VIVSAETFWDNISPAHAVEASVKKGMLTVTLPKNPEAQKQRRRI
jgi:HSP20 family molecular chaperone IbpA